MTEDDGEVGAGKKIQICVKILRKDSAAMNLQGCWSYTSDLGSQVVFTLPFLPQPQNVQMIMLVVSEMLFYVFNLCYRMIKNYAKLIYFITAN